jgi:exodeoxyribonuclease VII small subunit
MADKKPTFEQMLKKLEGITARLEAGELSLEKSLDAFEEGMKLARELDQTLSQAEAKVELLLKKENGQVQAEPWTEADEEDV